MCYNLVAETLGRQHVEQRFRVEVVAVEIGVAHYRPELGRKGEAQGPEGLLGSRAPAHVGKQQVTADVALGRDVGIASIHRYSQGNQVVIEEIGTGVGAEGIGAVVFVGLAAGGELAEELAEGAESCAQIINGVGRSGC